MIAILDDQQDVESTLSYYPGIDRPHSLMTDSETYYYATDPTGSVSGLAEFTGAASVTHRYRYDMWGKPRGSATEAVPNPIRFKARLWDDDTGLADFRARWYPDIGRFISEDPIGLAGGINVYRFVGNDPVSGWDPFGMSDPDDCPTSGDGGYWTEDADGKPAFVLEPLGVCAEQESGELGPGPPMPSGPSGFPLPPGGNRSGPGSGGPGGAGTVDGPCREGFVFIGGECRQLLTGVVPDFVGPGKLGGLIRGFAIDHRGIRHGLHRAIGRDGHGVSSAAILDALRNPQRIVQQARGTVRYVGNHATVIMNDARELVTTWATSRSGWRF